MSLYIGSPKSNFAAIHRTRLLIPSYGHRCPSAKARISFTQLTLHHTTINAGHAVTLYCLCLIVIVIAWYSKTQACADTTAIIHSRALVFPIKMGIPLGTTIGQPSRTRGNSNGNINDHFDVLSVSVSFAIVEVGQSSIIAPATGANRLDHGLPPTPPLPGPEVNGYPTPSSGVTGWYYGLFSNASHSNAFNSLSPGCP
ncbi:hypothetical protein P692DRAFT_201806270 [Suillus brevipes Sb2]|nr:hypothetical protein P692DRAFT_201806270 [Suillus brevipes Sb2]